MKKIRCLGDEIENNLKVCYFIHNGDWEDKELHKHEECHNEKYWLGFEEIKNG